MKTEAKRMRHLAFGAIASLLLAVGVAGTAHAAPSIAVFDTASGHDQCDAELTMALPGSVELPAASAHTDAASHRDLCSVLDFDGILSPTNIDDRVRTIKIALPPGVLGNPNAVGQKCLPSTVNSTASWAMIANCAGTSQIGTAMVWLNTGTIPGAVYVLESGIDRPARIVVAFRDAAAPVPLTVDARTESDYGVDTITEEVNSQYFIERVEVFLWGVPNANPRGEVPYGIGNLAGITDPVPVAAPLAQRAFTTLPTVCDAPKLTTLSATFIGAPEVTLSEQSEDPTPTNCSDVPFVPSFDLQPTSTRADDAAGLEVKLEIPQPTDPNELGSSHLRRAEVTLPEGTTLNPSAAAGLQACTDAQFKHGTRLPAECPPASKIGTVEFDVPLLTDTLKGSIYLGEALDTNPQSGRMFRVFQVAEGFGLNVKIPGYAKADPATGRVRAVFGDADVDDQIDPGEGLPQVPFSEARLSFKGGDRGIIATPQECGPKSTHAVFTPWAVGDPVGAPRTRDVTIQSSFTVSADGNGASCPATWPFTPSLRAGTSPSAGRSHTSFAFGFARGDRQPFFAGLTAELPLGLLASVRGVQLCTDAQADVGACPPASKIGTVNAGAGAGSPFYVEQQGAVYLTEGYRGGPYGLMVRVPETGRLEAGPFRGSSALEPIVLRQKVEVDPVSAQVRAIAAPADPQGRFPEVWHGVPLRVRDVRVNVDRAGFMLNPSSCAAKDIKAHLTSTKGEVASVSNSFRASGCAALPFKPKLRLRLTGRKQVTTGRHPGVRAIVTQAGIGEAGIKKAVVRLPKSLALDPNNAQALCEFADGTQPDLENRCPRGSIVGRARAVSPLLNRPLVGNVYFVKNVRRDPETGNEIRTLPMIIVALRGEIAVNLKGESDTTKGGKLVNTFASPPDAPISRFNLNIKGGKNGILAVTRTRRSTFNLCRMGRQIAEADMDGQNGRRHDFNVAMRKPCRKKAKPACKGRKKSGKAACKRIKGGRAVRRNAP